MKELKPDIRRVSTEKEKMICAAIMTGSEPWITLGVSEGQVISTFNDSLNKVFATYAKKEIVGTFVIQTKGAFSGYLKSIAVKSGWRGKNPGKIMMEFIENEIFSQCANVFSCVSAFNPDAKRLYINLGYEEIGELINYLVEGHDEILLRKTTGPILERSR